MLGPIVDAPGELLGSWSGHGRGEEVYPVRDALTEEFGGTSQVIFHAGCPFDGDDRSGFASALEAAREADVVVLFRCGGALHGRAARMERGERIALLH